ncbi:MAG: DUF7901 domain-containing protein, partial [Planctomycetota bacterium]
MPPGQVITSARLWLFWKELGGSSRIDVSAHHAYTDAWTENTINWNNAPGFNSTATDTKTVGANKWTSWDVTVDARNAYLGDGVLSEVMRDATEYTQGRWVGFESKDGLTSANRPYLEVEYQPGPQATGLPKPLIKHSKWSQPPIEMNPASRTATYCGWDEPSYVVEGPPFQICPAQVADDFRCIGAMPVRSIHWWGSHVAWDGPEPPELQPISWSIAFWSNVPAGADSDYSQPGEWLWHRSIPANRVKVEMVGRDHFPERPSDTCFQYTLYLEPNDYFHQGDFLDKTDDNVFWISIQAFYRQGTPIPVLHPWGWKTRPAGWMDVAVKKKYKSDPFPGVCYWTPIEDSAVCGLERYDLAFELDTDPNYIKWEQHFTGIRDWAHYEDEESMAEEIVEQVVKWQQPPDLSETGIDVDATRDVTGRYPPQLLANDFMCTERGAITDITVYGSWWRDMLPFGEGEPGWGDPGQVIFWLSLHEDLPVGHPDNPNSWSMPGPLLWHRPFHPGEFSVELLPWHPQESYYMPCTNIFTPFDHTMVWRYGFSLKQDEFIQQGTADKPVIYWLDVQAESIDPNPEVRFGWKTAMDRQIDAATWVVGVEPYEGPQWEELIDRHLVRDRRLDLAFEIGSQKREINFRRLVADDWPCTNNQPVTAAVWWGSYIGYTYQACDCQQFGPPAQPDYFLLSIWSDVRPTVDVPYSHPGEKIWQYKAYDYDEVLVGYDKHPHTTFPPREPVFRYSVRLPFEKWFAQKEEEAIYWFSVVAVYERPIADIQYPWGWTNHKCTAWEPEGLAELAHWKLNETGGLTAHDSSPNANHGTLVDGPTWQTGRICGGALEFSDANDYVDCGNSPIFDLTDEITLSAWVNIHSVPTNWTTIVSKGDTAWRLSTELLTSQFHLGVTGGPNWAYVYGTTAVANGEWHHVCGTFDGSTMQIYLDGALDGSKNYVGNITTNDLAVFIGGNSEKAGEGYRSWHGLIDDVRIYSQALSASDVEALAEMGMNDAAVAGMPDPTGATDEWIWE